MRSPPAEAQAKDSIANSAPFATAAQSRGLAAPRFLRSSMSKSVSYREDHRTTFITHRAHAGLPPISTDAQIAALLDYLRSPVAAANTEAPVTAAASSEGADTQGTGLRRALCDCHGEHLEAAASIFQCSSASATR